MYDHSYKFLFHMGKEMIVHDQVLENVVKRIGYAHLFGARQEIELCHLSINKHYIYFHFVVHGIRTFIICEMLDGVSTGYEPSAGLIF